MSGARESFELSLLGGPVERRYRRMRPVLDELPWGSLEPQAYPPEVVQDAQRLWTVAAFNEHRSAAAAAETVRALVTARAPVDLAAMASGFVADELSHVEACARVAMELGGAIPLEYQPHGLIKRAGRERPLLEAACLIVRHYCVEEAVSAPLLTAAVQSTSLPLLKGIFGVLAKDEQLHSQLGWLFLDWAAELLDEAERARLAEVAAQAITRWVASWPPPGDTARNELGALGVSAYRDHAREALEQSVLIPLRERAIEPVLVSAS